MRLDSAGKMVWANGFADIGTGSSKKIILTQDSACIIGASPFPRTNAKGGLIKVDLAGQIKWAVGFGSSEYPYLEAIEQFGDGSILCGVTLGSNPDDHSEVYKFSSDGVALWSRQFAVRTQIHGMTNTSDGSVVVCGTDGNTSFNSSNVFVVKLDPVGIQLWGQTVDAFGSESAYSIAEGRNGDVVIAGKRNKDSLFFIRMDAYGRVASVKQYSPAQRGIARYITPTADDTYTVTGSIYDAESENDNLLIMNLNYQLENCHMKELQYNSRPLGSLGDSLSVASSIDSVRSHFSTGRKYDSLLFVTSDLCNPASVSKKFEYLVDVFPNPATDVLHLSLNAEIGTAFIVELRDILGRIVKQSIVEMGTDYRILFNLPDCEAGSYFVELRNGDLVYKGKFLKNVR